MVHPSSGHVGHGDAWHPDQPDVCIVLNDTQLAALGVDLDDVDSVASLSACQRIGDAAAHLRAEALMVPFFRAKGGTNLVIFTTNADMDAGSYFEPRGEPMTPGCCDLVVVSLGTSSASAPDPLAAPAGGVGGRGRPSVGGEGIWAQIYAKLTAVPGRPLRATVDRREVVVDAALALVNRRTWLAAEAVSRADSYSKTPANLPKVPCRVQQAPGFVQRASTRAARE